MTWYTVEMLRDENGNDFNPFHIVLIEPEIPPNTGNIARLCGATGTILHLVGKLGFSTDDRYLKRAGLDYWHSIDIRYKQDFGAVLDAHPGARMVCTSARHGVSHTTFRFSEGDFLVFGKETEGLPPEILEKYRETTVRIPIFGNVRSINLSTAAGIVLYEALRQTGRLGREDP